MLAIVYKVFLMIDISHPYYSKFKLKRKKQIGFYTWSTYVLGDIEVKISLQHKLAVSSVSVKVCGEIVLDNLFFKDFQDFQSVLDRIGPVRLACQQYISLKSVVALYGSS